MKWEYETVWLSPSLGNSPMDSLKRMGGDGWELAGIWDKNTLIFKRPLLPQSHPQEGK